MFPNTAGHIQWRNGTLPRVLDDRIESGNDRATHLRLHIHYVLSACLAARSPESRYTPRALTRSLSLIAVWANSQGTGALTIDAHRRIISEVMRDCGYDGFRVLHALKHLGVHQQQQHCEISDTMLRHYARWAAAITRF